MGYKIRTRSLLLAFVGCGPNHMLCDLCREHSSRIIRVNSWLVCQWCLSNNVLEHAFEVESDIAKLRVTISKARTTHEHDVRNKKVAETKFELASMELTAAKKELATSTAYSAESLRVSLAAKKALEGYVEKEQRRIRRSRH